MVGSFYDPELDEGCAFEELISFHGGLGGPQTRPFILYPSTLELGDEPIVGAAAVHALLKRWRRELESQGSADHPLGAIAQSDRRFYAAPDMIRGRLRRRHAATAKPAARPMSTSRSTRAS